MTSTILSLENGAAIAASASLAAATPEEAYKRFVHGISEAIDEAVAKKLEEILSAVSSNPSANTVVNGVNWLHEYLVGRTVGLHYNWPTPGYGAPRTVQHHIVTQEFRSEKGEVSTQGVAISIGATISF